MRAIVIGADGFVGRWLLRHLVAAGDQVVALVGPGFVGDLDQGREVHQADVRDAERISNLIQAAAPEAVYYLAAVSSADAREEVARVTGVAIVGAVNVFVACASLVARPRFLYVSSAHVYGNVGPEPVAETTSTRPTTLYGAAKAGAEATLLQLGRAAGVEVIVARPFNHVGPGQRPGFVVPSLLDQIRAVQSGTISVVRVRTPQAVRDFTDVRDVVRAYRILMEGGEAGSAYNVASGRGTLIKELAAMMLDAAGGSTELALEEGPDRPGEPRTLVGDATRLKALGWQPTIGLRQTLEDVLRSAR